ncbi:MAG: hypothetical protein VW235_01370 [Rhodospirillaceae bacterium]|jgi:hypothetical protein
MDVVYEWNKLEADFLRWYKVEEPLEITWRKFLLLMSGLPMDKSLFFAKHYEEALREKGLLDDDEGNYPSSSSSDYKKELDAKSHRRGRQRNRISLDQFIAQSNGLGAKTNLKDLNQ